MTRYSTLKWKFEHLNYFCTRSIKWDSLWLSAKALEFPDMVQGILHPCETILEKVR